MAAKAAKIKLGERPKNFKRVVTFPMLEGGHGTIEVTYKYRTRPEYGAFLDELTREAQDRANAKVKEAKEAKAKEGDAEAGQDAAANLIELFTQSAETQKTIVALHAEHILRIAEDWNVDEREFTRENVEQLAGELPAAAQAIMDDYRAVIVEGRLGN